MIRLFPDNPKVGALPDRILKARNDVKRQLLQEYGEAVRKNDIDAGVKIGAATQEAAEIGRRHTGRTMPW